MRVEILFCPTQKQFSRHDKPVHCQTPKGEDQFRKWDTLLKERLHITAVCTDSSTFHHLNLILLFDAYSEGIACLKWLSLGRSRTASSILNLLANTLRGFSSEVTNTSAQRTRESMTNQMMYSDINSRIGSCMPLSAMRIGTIIHNIELNPGQGGKLVRAAGTSAKILKEPTSAYCLIQMPSEVKS